MKYLIIAAHPDDEILGCGGSMAKWIKEGHDVYILIMAEGATSRDLVRDRKKRTEELNSLKLCANKAAKILGINTIELLDCPDNRMDSMNLLDVTKIVEKYVSKYNPDVIVTHHIGDTNIDHQVIHQAVITACRPTPKNKIKRILSFEVQSSTEWQSPVFNRPFIPNWFEDISKTLSLKLQALEAYKPEMMKWPHARSIKSAEHLAKLRGSSIGIEASEAFMLVREIR